MTSYDTTRAMGVLGMPLPETKMSAVVRVGVLQVELLLAVNEVERLRALVERPT